MDRQKALEQFLNDKVTPIKRGLFFWHDKYYEVLPYSLTLKRRNWSGFIRLDYGKNIYMMREASDQILKKYYEV